MSCEMGYRRVCCVIGAAVTIVGMTTTSTARTRVLAVYLRGVTKRFGPVTAVDNLTLSIEQGEIVAFLGPNGAGKTSTIDMMLGLSRPNAGTVAVYGRKPVDAIARGEIAAVMQTGGLLKDLTVAETVRLTGTLFPHAPPTAEVLDRAGIASIA